MKLTDLKSGDIVEIRNGEKYIVLKDDNLYGGCNNMLISLKDGCFYELSNYNEDLIFKYNDDGDIIKVCNNKYVGDNFRHHGLTKEISCYISGKKWTWIRDDETVMTISEIEEKLGIKNLKIKNDD